MTAPTFAPAPADFLWGGIALNEKGVNVVDVPPGTQCRVSGQPIARGVSVQEVVTSASAEFLDQFRGEMFGYVSEAAGRCYKSAAPSEKHAMRATGRLVANPCAKSHLACELADGTFEYLSPAFDPVTAVANETVSWSAAVREVWPRWEGRNVFILITPDFKRRLWPYARAGVMGAHTPVYILNKGYNLDGQFHLNWPRLIALLDTVERLYHLGYTKDALLKGLLTSTPGTLEKVGAALVGEKPKSEKPAAYKQRTRTAGQNHAFREEATLRPLRSELEYTVAVMIAAREVSEAEMDKALKKRGDALAQAKADKASKKAGKE